MQRTSQNMIVGLMLMAVMVVVNAQIPPPLPTATTSATRPLTVSWDLRGTAAAGGAITCIVSQSQFYSENEILLQLNIPDSMIYALTVNDSAVSATTINFDNVLPNTNNDVSCITYVNPNTPIQLANGAYVAQLQVTTIGSDSYGSTNQGQQQPSVTATGGSYDGGLTNEGQQQPTATATGGSYDGGLSNQGQQQPSVTATGGSYDGGLSNQGQQQPSVTATGGSYDNGSTNQGQIGGTASTGAGGCAAQANCAPDQTAELPAPKFVDGAFIQGPSCSNGTSDILQLRIRSTLQFQEIHFQFVNSTSSYCDYSLCDYANTNNNLWSETYQSCQVDFLARLSFTRALNECFMKEDDNADYTLYRGIISVQTVQYRNSIRGVLITRNVTTGINLLIRLPKRVNVVVTPLSVAAALDVQSETYLQKFDFSTRLTRVGIITSLSRPLSLNAVGSIVGDDYFATPTIPNEVLMNSVSQCTATSPACNQYWETDIGASNSSTCYFQTVVSYLYNVSCVPGQLGCAPLLGTPVNVTYELAANDYCPKLIFDGQVQAQLYPYMDAQLTQPSFEFVFGTRAYILVDVQSLMGPRLQSVSLDSINVGSVQINQAVGDLSVFTVPGKPGQLVVTFLLNEQTLPLNSTQTVLIQVAVRVSYLGLNGKPVYKLLRANMVPQDQTTQANAAVKIQVKSANSNNNNNGIITQASSATHMLARLPFVQLALFAALAVLLPNLLVKA